VVTQSIIGTKSSSSVTHPPMRRFLLTIRWLLEGTAAFFVLLIVPFIGVDLAHSGAGIPVVLVGFLILCVLFLLGLLLFRDAIQIRLRLQKKA
jgi:hypothetical protein